MSSSIKTERTEQGKGLEKRDKCCERNGRDIERGQVIKREERRGGGEVKTRGECENKLRAAEMLPRHPEGNIEVQQGHRLR